MIICDEEYCTGCGACHCVCPQNAIRMEYSLEGFLIPVIDNGKCNGCSKCQSVCPVLSKPFSNENVHEFSAMKAESHIREKSSSGGVFYILADYTINVLNGYVCGAVWDDTMQVEHIISNDMNDVLRMQGSKYVQSSMGGVFTEIDKLLKRNNYVLFSGTPCQIAGLKNFLNFEYDTLLLVDDICSGISSAKVFKNYIQGRLGSKKIKKISFGDKSLYRWSVNISIFFEDGTIYRSTTPDDAFLSLFENGYSLRSSCGDHCCFNSGDRQADITIGDFWGVWHWEKRHQNSSQMYRFSDGLGTSVVSVNTSKGRKIVDACKSMMSKVVSITMGEAVYNNYFLMPILYDRKSRNRFFSLMINKGFDTAYKYVIENRYDIALFGLWNGNNYGAMITAKALYKQLKSLGYEVLLINTEFRYGKRNNEIHRYITDSCEVSHEYKYKEELYELNYRCDMFMVGSDQCWGLGINRMYREIFFLDFANEDKKKISYGTSFGTSEFTGDYKTGERYSKFLNKFDGISVRETEGKEICQKLGINHVSHVIDPIFFMEDPICEESPAFKSSSYALNYILDITPSLMKTVDYINTKTGEKDVVTVLGLDYTNSYDIPLEKVTEVESVNEFINFFQKCSYVVTDSYHGMCLAIIFNKPFSIIVNEYRGKCRFESLLKKLDLMTRSVNMGEDLSSIDFSEIDWKKVNGKVDDFKKVSLDWLINRLQYKKKNEKDDVIDIKNQLLELKYSDFFKMSQRKVYEKDFFLNPAIQRIVLFYEKELRDNSIIAIRGGGYHTIVLMSLILPIIDRKKICFQVFDKKAHQIAVSNRTFNVVPVSEVYFECADAVIISSWKYRDEIIDEVENIIGRMKKKPLIYDVYTDLDLNPEYPFYNINSNR